MFTAQKGRSVGDGAVGDGAWGMGHGASSRWGIIAMGVENGLWGEGVGAVRLWVGEISFACRPKPGRDRKSLVRVLVAGGFSVKYMLQSPDECEGLTDGLSGSGCGC
ncbi:hypothetical protein [Kamptonema formosum]|uniref:hypothetical protein n=1 Tax=Kamptonema formosum TaxID=331992 RepID=UPI0012DDC2AB|nr:hypothetical protein [Oscillatoria sp. PCC 10802]